MSHVTTELKQEFKKNLERLQTLRDEVRLKMHLAGMDAKTEWNKLEPHIDKVEHDISSAAGDVSDASRSALDDVIKKLQKLRDTMH